MVTEIQDALTQRYLQEVMPDFEICSRRAIECTLGLATRCPREFRLLPALFHQNSLTCNIHSGNDDFGVNLIVGVNQSDFHELLPQHSSEVELVDVVGEMANVIAGNFLSRGAFRERFGQMLPSPPFISFNESHPRKGWSLQGNVLLSSSKIFVGFLVHSSQKVSPI